MYKKIWSLLILSLCSIVLIACKDTEEGEIPVKKIYNVESYVTTGNQTKLLEKNTDAVTEFYETLNGTAVTIDPSKRYQTMDGFGAAMTESSAVLIQNLSAEAKEAVMNDLFSNSGIEMSFVRIPMGASDFALSNYSYNDIPVTETDLNMEQFSLSRDLDSVVPVLQLAKSKNPDIQFMGSPWSAPAWMKDNKSMNGGKLLMGYKEAYALYFAKFIEAYGNLGLPIYAITPQNEPLHQTGGYPSMYMTASEQVELVIALGRLFENRSIDTKIIAYDHNWDNTQYPMTVLNDRVARNYVDGAGFHCYAGSVEETEKMQRLFPNMEFWFTECSGGAWATSFADNMTWNMENVFMGSMRYGAKGVLLWNIALNPNHGPQNGGCTNCRGVVTIDPVTETYTKNVEYYLIGHFSKFVSKGATRVDALSSNPNVITVAFENPDGSIVVVAHNKANVNAIFDLNIHGSKLSQTLAGKSTVTYVLTEMK